MASERQITANRLNALQSTGPITPEGKTVVSQNAVQHGILSEKTIHSSEDNDTFESFKLAVMNQCHPVGALEVLLVEQIISNAWRLRRVLSIECEILFLEDSFEALSIETNFSRNDGTLGLLSRYETQIQRSLYRALHELQRLQAARFGAGVSLPVAVDLDISAS